MPGNDSPELSRAVVQGKVPTAGLLGEAVTVDGLGEALSPAGARAPRPRRDLTGW
jgi:hypothetical protein